MKGIFKVATWLLLLASHGSWVSAQDLTDTSGWALRGNGSCPSSGSECGPSNAGFVACCPPASPCQLQPNNRLCCPQSNPNCTDALVANGPRCADPGWIMCQIPSGEYFCCIDRQICYYSASLMSVGCADRDYPFYTGDVQVSEVLQVPRSVTTISTSSSATTTPIFPDLQTTSLSTSAVITTSSTPASSSPTPTQEPSKGLNTSDKIAIGVGVPAGVAGFLATWIAWKMYKRQMKKHPQA